MTNVNRILRLTAFILTVIILSSCNDLKMTNVEAKSLIIVTLGLPQKFHEDVSGSNIFRWDKAMKAGFIHDPGNCSWGCNLVATEKGKQYLIRVEGKGGYPMNYNHLIFKGFDIDFCEVTGISINKDDQTAVIRFNLKATNISPVSQALEDNINNARNSELIFKKFDNGWQLASNQNKSGIDVVREIWWGKK